MKVTPPLVPMPGIAGGEKAKARPPGISASSAFTCFMIALYCSSGALRSLPFLQRDEEEAAVGGVDASEEVVADDRGHSTRHPGVACRISSHLPHDLVGALQRSGIGQNASARRNSPGLPPAGSCPECACQASPAENDEADEQEQCATIALADEEPADVLT